MIYLIFVYNSSTNKGADGINHYWNIYTLRQSSESITNFEQKYNCQSIVRHLYEIDRKDLPIVQKPNGELV